MKAFSLAWLLGRPVRGRMGPQLLTASAYSLTAALLMLVAAGGLSFTAVQDDLSGLYLVLAGIAVALLVVPLAVLGAAVARLSARSHDQGLATVRLLGGTPHSPPRSPSSKPLPLRSPESWAGWCCTCSAPRWWGCCISGDGRSGRRCSCRPVSSPCWRWQ